MLVTASMPVSLPSIWGDVAREHICEEDARMAQWQADFERSMQEEDES